GRLTSTSRRGATMLSAPNRMSRIVRARRQRPASTLSSPSARAQNRRSPEGSMTVKNRTGGRLAWSLALVALALTAAGFAFGAKNGSYPLLLFPVGRLPSRRWRPVAWLGAVAIVVAVVPVAVVGWKLRGPLLLYSNEPPPSLPHSYRLAVTVLESAFSFIFLLAFVGAASLLVRRRRATGEEREQIGWFAYGGFLMGVGMVVSIPGVGPEGLVLVGFLALPTAGTIAIL